MRILQLFLFLGLIIGVQANIFEDIWNWILAFFGVKKTKAIVVEDHDCDAEGLANCLHC